MAFGKPSFIATALLGDELAGRAVLVRAEDHLFNSTSGPWAHRGSIDGAAMTAYTITCIVLRGEGVVVFADEHALGWAQSSDIDRILDLCPRISVNTVGLRPMDESPWASLRP